MAVRYRGFCSIYFVFFEEKEKPGAKKTVSTNAWEKA